MYSTIKINEKFELNILIRKMVFNKIVFEKVKFYDLYFEKKRCLNNNVIRKFSLFQAKSVDNNLI